MWNVASVEQQSICVLTVVNAMARMDKASVADAHQKE